MTATTPGSANARPNVTKALVAVSDVVDRGEYQGAVRAGQRAGDDQQRGKQGVHPFSTRGGALAREAEVRADRVGTLPASR